MKNNREKTEDIMRNVMAALNTYGVEYDTNVWGHEVERQISYLVDGKTKTLDNPQFDFMPGFKEFIEAFKEFVDTPHYSKVRGWYWADSDDYVVIQFARSYNMDDNDWQEYANMCGYDDPCEAQAMCGDPQTTYIRLNVRIPKGAINLFVQRYAHYCW